MWLLIWKYSQVDLWNVDVGGRIILKWILGEYGLIRDSVQWLTLVNIVMVIPLP
jgi:hypothetical protein